MSTSLLDLLDNLGRPRLLVVGDLMLDRYIWGNAARVSQEAPVLLLHADHREERLGGASSVATMARALGADVCLAGVVGNDGDGRRVTDLLASLDIESDGVIADGSRPTTVKERYIGRAQSRHPQQIIRVDYETRAAVDATHEKRLIDLIKIQARRCRAILISDYDKGVCTPAVTRAAIEAARAAGIPVLADPARGGDYQKYRNCTTVTPNRLEAGLATGLTIQSPEQALIAAEWLLDALELDFGLITLDKDGMAMAASDGRRELFPTRPRQVYDITGAGDMVLSVLGLAAAAGADWADAIRLANVAGGLEVEKIGVATVSRDEIRRDLIRPGATTKPVGEEKLLPVDELTAELGRLRQAGRTIAFTNGCFDVLHVGHVQYLREARAQADVLVVAVNSDSGVSTLKGPGRPVNPLEARAMVLAGLDSVDYVTAFDALTPIDVIRAVRPDVLVKGADYRRDQVVGADFVESYGGRVHLAEFRPGYSTTHLLTRLKAA